MIIFHSNSNLGNWRIVDDIVMGGVSKGNFKINESGHIEFFGHVSLENNGGFSMIQYHFTPINISGYSKLLIQFKGDGKAYQFRVKENINDKASYVYSFTSDSKLQNLKIPFNLLKPKFRGKALSLNAFSGKQLSMIAFLIGNKKAEDFKLEIISIELLK